ncbi:MAG: succinate dehydrogenase/fumarate reductase iron-sulfur subunit [Verrucomicrobiales bacterium]|jgi:succinate dehydrogenase / fumarate reductase iron-sulfur subunit|nr:succinate dehydrogenase/fumarate reductase iron-sulfur subunit [Verrucomicrobiales bacterium]
MNVKLKVWRQASGQQSGGFEEYEAKELNPNMSFLEMLDEVNEELIQAGKEPITFEHDCREGICGSCSLMIGGEPHGPEYRVASCQTYMRSFKDGDVITIEPFRSKAFPVLKDLVVDRSAFDRIIQAGGFISVSTGSAPDANSIPVPKVSADLSMDAAACIGCGACVASCKNGAAMLFASAKAAHLNLLPQGQAEKDRRVLAIVETMDAQGFGSCSNTYACESACPKGITVDFIAKLNRDYALASVRTKLLGAAA